MAKSIDKTNVKLLLIRLKLLVIVFFFASFNVKQTLDKVNCVTYKTSFYSNPVKHESDYKIFLEKAKLLEFNLFYNTQSSLFIQTESQVIDNDMSDHILWVLIAAGKSHYKNIDTKEKIEQKNMSRQDYNVIKDFDEYKWTVTNETKIIKGYQCTKAITEVEVIDEFTNTSKIYKPFVWFTPKIPAPYGPKGLDGLPGLVLEGTFNGNFYFYVSKIEFDCKQKKIIDRPSNYKYITEKEFLKLGNDFYKKHFKK